MTVQFSIKCITGQDYKVYIMFKVNMKYVCICDQPKQRMPNLHFWYLSFYLIMSLCSESNRSFMSKHQTYLFDHFIQYILSSDLNSRLHDGSTVSSGRSWGWGRWSLRWVGQCQGMFTWWWRWGWWWWAWRRVSSSLMISEFGSTAASAPNIWETTIWKSTNWIMEEKKHLSLIPP